jgi:hypothetical protein
MDKNQDQSNNNNNNKSSAPSSSKAINSRSIFAKKRNNSFQLSNLLEKVSFEHNDDNAVADLDDNNELLISNKQRRPSSILKMSTLNTETPNLIITTTTNHLNANKARPSPSNHHHHHNHNYKYNSNNHVNNMPISRSSSLEYYNLKLSRSKLKAVTRTSALLSGFAMVAMVELTLNYDDYFDDLKSKAEIQLKKMSNTKSFNKHNNNNNNSTINSSFDLRQEDLLLNNIDVSKYLVPEWILVMYSLVTCLLVGVNMLALMISTCILPVVEASSLESFDFEQTVLSPTIFNANHSPINVNNSSNFNNLTLTSPLSNQNHGKIHNRFAIYPHKRFHRSIEFAWIMSTVIGIFLFLVEILIVCFIKFYPISFYAGIGGLIVMAPILVFFVVFTFTFYKRLAHFKINITEFYLKQV